ncbi:MAG: putative DNA modification/repair radical SAM protein [Phenylobacterium sp.]|uniref:putative DNA modification/repair radical SAM protein n=1 Tax=Phenylobacterium sp. TaxID=1871053 RepID=UPI0027278F3D|nr:putative DNA modification/repair radical SAM protein [Phenylobacterium sp.]MDO8913781.1 putative DNA modification/repair radical SAM protein [Phenylobacterium sp.]MDP3100610.1 putative DNA modification/repair radical SAM protein [Phenylobacterium sp.]
MVALTLKRKLEILSDAAKYDASCASSGTVKRDSMGGKGVGSTDGGMGICHAYAPDGRCISLLKILLTNFCVYDCAYCVNRVSSNTPRARFTVAEVVDLTLSFYKRNYIEGLFLSSGIIKSGDYTMEEMVRVAKSLRIDHDFRGYIHLKVIPEASPALVNEAALYADRISINVELPRDASLADLAPEKDAVGIKKAMGWVRLGIDQTTEKVRKTKPPKFAPAGQSTQMIVGADAATDGEILAKSAGLYGAYGMRRVYYSAYSPIPDTTSRLPPVRPPLMREHRLYQADWLMRFYGFTHDEITVEGVDLDLDIDPKLAWALRNRGDFPVNLNTAERETMLRVPGLGVRSVERMIDIRRYKQLTLEDVKRLTRRLDKLKPFIVTADWRPGALTDKADLRARLAPPTQLSLF